jgi:hypothetical protein
MTDRHQTPQCHEKPSGTERSLAGLRTRVRSRTASSSTRTRTAAVFLMFERPYSCSQLSIALSTSPAVMRPSGPRTRCHQPLSAPGCPGDVGRRGRIFGVVVPVRSPEAVDDARKRGHSDG